MIDIPILLLVFNRPEKTSKVFEAICQFKPTKLYVAADGPRPSKESDIQLCEQTRNIFNAISWPCKLQTLYHDKNLGCGRSGSTAISWFFENETQGVIFEDDCLPSVDFLPYCSQLLERYHDNNEIGIISGNAFAPSIRRSQFSYDFTIYTHIWGWATWKRTWELFDIDIAKNRYDDVYNAILKVFDT